MKGGGEWSEGWSKQACIARVAGAHLQKGQDDDRLPDQQGNRPGLRPVFIPSAGRDFRASPCSVSHRRGRVGMTVWRRPSLLLNQLRRIRDTQPPPLLLQLQLVRQARPRTLQSDFSVASTRHRIAQLPANDSDRGWGNLDEGPGPPAHMAKYKYYAVARGRVPGVYSTW